MFSTNMPAPARMVLLSALAGVHVLAVILASLVARETPHEDSAMGILLGLSSGQTSVSAVVLALGPGRLLTRLGIAMLVLALAGLPFLCFALSDGEMKMVLMIDGALAAQFGLLQIPLWVARRKWGVRLGLANEIVTTEARPHQFGIRQLLLWTAGVACLFGIGKWVLPVNITARFQGGPDLWQLVVVCLLLMVFHTILPLPLIWGAFAHHPRGLPLHAVRIAVALVLVVVLTFAEPWAFNLLLRQGSGDNGIFYWLNGAHASWLLGSLLIVRICGYRLAARTAPG